MRKNMQRIMSTMLILLLLIPSLAMAQTNIDIDYIQEDNNVTINIKGVRNRPVSITIKDESRYYYIEQGVTDDLGKAEFRTTLDTDKTYDCQVNIDGETVTKKIVMKKLDHEIEEPEHPENPENPEKPSPKPVEPIEPEAASLYIKGYNGVILNKSNIKINKGETVLSLTTRVLDEEGISYENRSGYIASIDGQGEGDKGPKSGWMFSVNGRFPNVGAGFVKVKNGDNISWLYTCDLGKDLGNPYEEDVSKDSQDNIIDKKLNIISDGKVTEKQKGKVIEDIIKYFQDKTKNIRKEEIDNILKESSEILNILTNVLENAKSEELVLKIAESSIEITKSLGNIIDSNTDLKTIEKISETSRENMGIALASIDKIEDKEKVDKIVDNIIETSTKIEEKYSNKTTNPNKNIEKIVAIKVVEKEDKASDITLPNVLLEKANEKKVDKVKLVTSKATIELSPEFLGNNINEDVKINIKSGKDGLSLGFKLGNKEQTQLQNPIKITMPFDKKVVNGDKITAVLIKEDGTKEAIGGIYDKATKSIKFTTNQSGKFTAEERTKKFKDTSKYKWAEDAIESMAVKGIIDGKSEHRFAPTDNITRAEFATLVSRMLKYNEKQEKQFPFKDVKKDKWYYNSIAAVYENGLMNGKSDKEFDPEGNLTREEMAKIVGSILEKNLYKKQDAKELSKFKDGNSVASWAQEAASIAVYNGVIDGSNGKFMPKSNATRAEAAVMLYRLYKLILD